jgi:hypothetical protein
LAPAGAPSAPWTSTRQRSPRELGSGPEVIVARHVLRLAVMVLRPGRLRLRLVRLGHGLSDGERRRRYFT